jgi:hypothetical protein
VLLLTVTILMITGSVPLSANQRGLTGVDQSDVPLRCFIARTNEL